MVNRRRQKRGQKETEGDGLDRKGRRRSHRDFSSMISVIHSKPMFDNEEFAVRLLKKKYQTKCFATCTFDYR